MNYLVEPVRNNWLQRLIDISLRDPSPFWCKGSVNRARQIADGVASISYLGLHSTSFDYRHYLIEKYEKHADKLTFDTLFGLTSPQDGEFKELLHNFKYDDYIIDLTVMLEYSTSEIRTENPYVHLVIGK